jgi:hypothetical protein
VPLLTGRNEGRSDDEDGRLRKIDARLNRLSKVVSVSLCFLVKRILAHQFGSVVCDRFLIITLVMRNALRRNEQGAEVLQWTAAGIRKLPIDLDRILARISLQSNSTVKRRDRPGSFEV